MVWPLLALTCIGFSLATVADCPAAVLEVPATYPTIQAAVNEAAAGDTIVVAPGTYGDPFAIPASKQSITISGDGTGIVRCRTASVYGSEITLTRLGFFLGEYGIYVGPGASCSLTDVECSEHDFGVFVDDATATLDGMTCRGNSIAGICITGPDAVATITGAELTGSAYGTGLLIKDGARAAVSETSLHGNRSGASVRCDAIASLDECAADDNEVGIEIADSAEAEVTESSFNDNRRGAQCTGAGSRLVMERSQMADNAEAGVHFTDGSLGAIRYTGIASSETGILVDSSFAVIQANRLRDHTHAGVCLRSPQHAEVQCENGQLFTEPFPSDFVADAVIIGNHFEGNGESGICLENSHPTDMKSLEDNNTFGDEDTRISCKWLGAIIVLHEGRPVGGSQVTLTSAAGEALVPYGTDGEGFYRHPFQTRYDRWFDTPDYITGPGGARVDHNPWALRATSGNGTLRGSCVYSWDGQHKEEGFDHEGRYQVARIDLNARPVANAGEDRTVTCDGDDATVILDASGCSDAEDDDLLFTWYEGDTVIAGPTTEPRVEVELKPGAHCITLSVDDGHDDPGRDDVIVTVTPRP